MSDDIQSLRRQLAEVEENLRLIQERKTEYVQATDVPLQLIKDEQRLEAQIADLRERLAVCQEPLTQLYEQLQAAAEHEEWAEVLAVGAHIRALDEGDRDVAELMELARERLQRPRRRPMPTWTWWVAAGGAAMVVLLGLGLALGPRLFGTSPAPTEAPAERPTEMAGAVATKAPT
jgi:flagellar biosynthesis chaperone FliJ